MLCSGTLAPFADGIRSAGANTNIENEEKKTTWTQRSQVPNLPWMLGDKRSIKAYLGQNRMEQRKKKKLLEHFRISKQAHLRGFSVLRSCKDSPGFLGLFCNYLTLEQRVRNKQTNQPKDESATSVCIGTSPGWIQQPTFNEALLQDTQPLANHVSALIIDNRMGHLEVCREALSRATNLVSQLYETEQPFSTTSLMQVQFNGARSMFLSSLVS